MDESRNLVRVFLQHLLQTFYNWMFRVNELGGAGVAGQEVYPHRQEVFMNIISPKAKERSRSFGILNGIAS